MIKPIIALAAVMSFAGAVAIALYLGDLWTFYDPLIGEFDLFDIIIFLDFVVFFCSAVGVCLWVYRAHSNLRLVRTPGAETAPGWAVAWYFIPIANVFMPYQAMKELWQGSVSRLIQRSETAPGIIWLWWLTWLGGNLASYGDSYSSLSVIGYLSLTLSAGTLFVIIDRITKAQPTMSIASTFE